MSKKIFLDAGHGGSDAGAVGNGLKEKDLTLILAKKVQAILNDEYEGAEIKLSRTGDTFPTLSQRTAAANKWGADLLISIHINAATSTAANGFETFIHTNTSKQTKAFQNVIHRAILKYINIDDRGQKAASLHMLRESNMTAVLTENGFISNKKEADLMKSDIWLNKVARGHAEGIAHFAGLARRAAAEQQRSTREAYATHIKVYRVQVGSFEDKKNADAVAADLRKMGYLPYVTES